MSIKVSIIIPMYNAKENIEKTVKSLLDSGRNENIEIIIIDNVSSDGSYSYTREIFKNQSKVKVFQTPTNNGPAMARNLGIDLATGTHIGFLDADDYVYSDYFSKILGLIEINPEQIIRFNFDSIVKGKSYLNSYFTNEVGHSGQQYYVKEITSFGANIQNMVWQFIIPKRFIIEEKIYFEEKPKYFEDVLYYVRICSIDANIAIIDEPLLGYVKSSNSMVNRTDDFSEKIDSFLVVADQLDKEAMKFKNYEFKTVINRQANLMIYFAYKFAWYNLLLKGKNKFKTVNLAYSKKYERIKEKEKLVKGNDKKLIIVFFKRKIKKLFKSL
jgi:succinoglycan biosynthesis protein ExoO